MGKLIRGWDEAMMTVRRKAQSHRRRRDVLLTFVLPSPPPIRRFDYQMRLGERAKITMTADYGYGAAGVRALAPHTSPPCAH